MAFATESAHTEHEPQQHSAESATRETAGQEPALFHGDVLSTAASNQSNGSGHPLLTHPVMRHSTGGQVRAIALRQAQQGLGNQRMQQVLIQARRSSLIQRECACGGTCSACQERGADEEAESQTVQRQATSAADGGTVDADVIPSDSPGYPLDEGTRDFMESRFGTDFSDVRVHSDHRAAESADALSANAYTTGRDIYFAAGKYAPSSYDGQHLLAHELTHTVQQENNALPIAASSRDGVLVGGANDPLEKEAEHTADSVVNRDASTPSVSPDAARTVRRGFRSRAAAVWNATGGRVVRGVEGLVEDTVDAVSGWLERRAPGLMTFLRSDPIEVLREKIGHALEGTLGGVFSRIQQEGLFGALSSLAAEGMEALAGLVHSVAADPCGAMQKVVEGLIEFQKWVASGLWDLLKKGASAVGSAFSYLWNDLALPAWDAVKKLAGSVWGWIEGRAKEFWDWIAPLRKGIATVWNKVKQLIGAAWDKGTDVFDWLKQKLSSAWDRVKATVQPILGPLKIIGGILLLLSPLGPIVVIGAVGYGLFQAARWLYNNWDHLEIVIKARKILHEQIIPWIHSAIGAVIGALHDAAKWLQDKVKSIGQALLHLAEALGANTLLRFAKSAVDWIHAKFNQFAAWVAGGFNKLVEAVAPTLKKIGDFLKPIGVVLAKLILAITNPILLPIYLGAVVWLILPDCIKPPLINYILDLMIGAIRAIPNWGFFGEDWPKIKEGIVKPLEDKRKKASTEEKITFSNKVANMIAGPDLTGFSNLFQAAKQSPEYFTGQVEEELVGMDLTQPLPLERAPTTGEGALNQQVAAGVGGGAIAPENLALLQKSVFADGDVQADSVPEVDMPPEFFDTVQLGPDGKMSFGENANPTITNESLRAELAGLTTPSQSGGAPGVGGKTEDMRPPADLPAEEQIRWFVSHQPETGCEPKAPPQSKVPTEAAVPAVQIFPPLTQGQRALFVWEQMKRGLHQWYQCHKTAVIASLIGALVLLVVLAVLTDGVILELLPEIMEVIGAIFIGVAVVKMSMYIADYVAKAVAGDVKGAAKSLARGLAIGAIEMLMYLLTAGTGKGAAKAGEKAVQEGVEGAAQAGKRTARPFMEAAADAGRRFLTNIKNPIGAFMRNGKAFIKGIESSFVRGVKSVKDLAERLLSRLGFKGFGAEVVGGWLIIYGYFNSRIALIEIPLLLQELRGEVTEIVAGAKIELRSAKGAGTYSRFITLAKDDLDAVNAVLKENKDLIQAAIKFRKGGANISVLDDFLFWIEGHHPLPMWMGGPNIPYKSPGLLGVSRLLHNFDPAGVHTAINALWRDSRIFGTVAINDAAGVRRLFRTANSSQRAIMLAEIQRIMEAAYRQTFSGVALEYALEALDDGIKNFRY